MSPTSLPPLVRLSTLVGALTVAALLLGSVHATDALAGGCGTKVASKRSDRVRLGGVREAVQCLINDERSARNLKLRRDLSRAAQRHTRYMNRHRCFSHQCPGEASTHSRIAKTGYMKGASSFRIGEVIALNKDKASPRDVVRQWKRSAGHRAQILSGGFKHIGVGMIARRGRAFYTVTLGYKSG